MKMLRISLVLIALVLSPAVGGLSVQAGERNENPLAEAGWFCPFCGGSYAPYDSTKNQQDTMRRYHHWMGIDNRQEVLGQYKASRPMDRSKATYLILGYLHSTGNPNLKLAGIAARDNYYEARIVTPDGSLVDIILVDKYTGTFRSVY